MDVSTIRPAVWAHAVAVFGSELKARKWLATPLAELKELTPEEVLTKDPGSDEVDAVLDRIEYGVFS